MARIGGKLSIAVNGTRLLAKGSFTINPGRDKRAMVVGHDEVHGHTEMPQVPSIEGPITVAPGTDLDELLALENAVVTCEAANGKTYTLRGAVWAADGEITTEEGELSARFEGLTMEIDP